MEVVAQNRGPLSDAALTAVYREIDSGCRSLVHQTRVAYLGPKFSYSYQHFDWDTGRRQGNCTEGW